MNFLNRCILIVLIHILTLPFLFAQTLRGTVVNESQKKLKNVDVYLMPGNHQTKTDSLGYYMFRGIKSGNYTLVLKKDFYENHQKNIHITPQGLSLGPIVLMRFIDESQNTLQTIEVVGRKEKGYKSQTTFSGTKTQTKLKDVPQSINYVTKELMQDQASTRLGDIARNISGVTAASPTYDDLTIRGFRVSPKNKSPSTQLLNGMRIVGSHWKQPPIMFLERVDVIKGSAAALYGNSSPGGTINRITRKPLHKPGAQILLMTEAFNSRRYFADATGPLNKSKTLLYRINLGYENLGSFRDLQFEKNYIVSPSLSFLVDDKTRINIDWLYNMQKSRLDRGMSLIGDDLYSVPISQSSNRKNDYLKLYNQTLTASFDRELTKDLKLTLVYAYTTNKEDLAEHRNSANKGAARNYVKALEKNEKGKWIEGKREIKNFVQMLYWERMKKATSHNVSAFLNYKKDIGATQHNVLLGYDYAHLHKAPYTTNQIKGNTKKTQTIEAADGQTHTIWIPKVPYFDLNNIKASQDYVNRSLYELTPKLFDAESYHLNGFYLQDQIKWKSLQLLLGLRFERYTDHNLQRRKTKKDEKKVQQSAFLPRVGVVYTLNENVNLYGTFSKGYNPQLAADVGAESGGPFEPLTNQLFEVGAKSDWFNKKLSITAAIYHITQRNELVPAEIDDLKDLQEINRRNREKNMAEIELEDFKRPIGKTLSRGIEFDVAGRLTKDWSLSANYAYNQSEITQSKNKYEIGTQRPHAPKHQAGVWSRYNFNEGFLKGLGFGLGANYVGERNLVKGVKKSLVKEIKQSIPSYILAQIAVYYRVDRLRFQANIDNVFNKVYWDGGIDYLRLFPGYPRRWSVSVAYTF